MSAVIGSLAGVLYATWMGFLHPDMFTFRESILVLALVACGGPGSISGILFATLLLIPLVKVLPLLLPAGLGGVAEMSLALLVVVFLRWRSSGRPQPVIRKGGCRRD